MADRSGRTRAGAAGESHRHRCREDHSWEHVGEAARACRIPEYASDLWGRYVSVEHCPVCTGQDDLLVRSAHPHRCPDCRAEWIHEGRCAGDAEARCPWCAVSPDAVAAQGRRRGTHVHYCPRCVQIWEHLDTCLAPHRVVLPECPGCGAGSAGPGTASMQKR